eukprot:2465316-Prymnesium_polylepis.2
MERGDDLPAPKVQPATEISHSEYSTCGFLCDSSVCYVAFSATEAIGDHVASPAVVRRRDGFACVKRCQRKSRMPKPPSSSQGVREVRKEGEEAVGLGEVEAVREVGEVVAGEVAFEEVIEVAEAAKDGNKSSSRTAQSSRSISRSSHCFQRRSHLGHSSHRSACHQSSHSRACTQTAPDLAARHQRHERLLERQECLSPCMTRSARSSIMGSLTTVRRGRPARRDR